jgi:hypothetical protein
MNNVLALQKLSVETSGNGEAVGAEAFSNVSTLACDSNSYASLLVCR